MDANIKRFFKIIAATTFLAGLVINISVTLTDPFIMMSDAAVAQTTSTDTTGTDTTGITTTLPEVVILCNTGGWGNCWTSLETDYLGYTVVTCPNMTTSPNDYCFPEVILD